MNTNLVLGFFDGIHIAHKELIQSAVKAGKTILITFKESPAIYFKKPYKYIYPREYSLNKIKDLGVNEILEFDFSQIAGMAAEDYVRFIVEKFSPKAIYTGFNHTFGANKIGNPELLEKLQKKYNYEYFCIPSIEDNGEIVSSTLIKNLIQVGNMERANRLLGTNFFIENVVQEGAKIGRTLDFPTANIEYPQNILQLPYGVYFIKYNEYSGLLNWGMRPTVNNIIKPVAEAHIIGFDGDLYGEKVRFEIIKKIRDEKKFQNLEELKNQIKKDIDECLKL